MRHLIKRTLFCCTGLSMLWLAACTTHEQAPAVKPAAHSLDQAIYMRARKAYMAKDYKTAAALLDPIAEKGNANAQYTLGYLYYYGKGVKRNLKQARLWFEKAAAQGHQRAVNALATIKAMKKNPPPVKSATPKKTAAKVIDLRVKKIVPESKPEPVTPPATPAPRVPVAVNPDVAVRIINPSPEPVTKTQPGTGLPPQTRPENKKPVISKKRLQLEEKGRQWIMNQPPEHFTIQLASSTREKSVLDFIHSVALDGVFLFRYTDKTGQVRLNVIHGSIFNFSNAKKKLKRLHERGFSNAWIRRIGPIQKMISHY